jgi:hypothetical protein
MILAFWKTSMANKDWLHVHLASFLTSPDQKKLLHGALAVFAGVLEEIETAQLKDGKQVEDALGIELLKVAQMAAGELGNKTQSVRKMCTELLLRCCRIAGKIGESDSRHKLVTTLALALKPLKPAIKDPLLQQIPPELVADLQRLFEAKASSPEKLPEDEQAGLIYAEPLSEELKQRLHPVMGYFSEFVTQRLYSQNWAARAAGLNKVGHCTMLMYVGARRAAACQCHTTR